MKTKSKAQPIGLARFIREVTPHIDPDRGEMTRRGIYKCKHGHTFTAVISDKEKICRECNKQSFALADLLRVKMMLKNLVQITEAPSFSISLRALVDQQNLRNKAAEIGSEIELATLAQIGKIADYTLRPYVTEGGKMGQLAALISNVVIEIDALRKSGSVEYAEQIKAELAGVLQGAASEKEKQ